MVMTRYWIFVSFPYSDFNAGTIQETINKIKQSGIWPIGKNTRFRKQISRGDKLLLYQAGEPVKAFVGNAELHSDIQSAEGRRYPYYVRVGNVQLWDRCLYVKDVVNDLSFVKDKMHYGAYLQGGITAIPEADYNAILTKVRQRSLSSSPAINL